MEVPNRCIDQNTRVQIKLLKKGYFDNFTSIEESLQLARNTVFYSVCIRNSRFLNLCIF